MKPGRPADWGRRLLVLDDVEDHPGTSSGHIARRTGLSIKQVRHVLASLERHGLIERVPPMGPTVRIWPREPEGPYTEGDA